MGISQKTKQLDIFIYKGMVRNITRKHEKFSYWYGCRTAPESYQFYFNGRLLELDSATKYDLGLLCLAKGGKAVEDELKRMLRKEEKQNIIHRLAIAFFVKNTNKFCYSERYSFNPDNVKEKLLCYKEFKQYIVDNDYKLRDQARTVESGEFVTLTEFTKPKKVNNEYLIDISRFCIVPAIWNEPIFCRR